MASFLVAYKSGEGQTAKVAETIESVLEARGHDTRAISVTEWTGADSVGAYDAVLIGTSVHMGRHPKAVFSFIDEHRDAIQTRPNAFFQLSLSAADQDDEDGQVETVNYIHKFIDKSEWEPDQIGVFGGALRYSEYGFLTRFMMKRIARANFGISDTSHDYEFTDWDEVETFATDFAVLVETELGTGGGAEESAA